MITINKIISIVCKYFGITEEQIQLKTRKREIVEARQIAMYFSRITTKKSFCEIGELIGNKDRATAMHSFSVVLNLYLSNKKFRTDINAIKNEIKSISDIDFKSIIQKHEIKEAILNGIIKVLNSRIANKKILMDSVSRDIISSCDRLTSGNVAHGRAALRSFAFYLKE